jgi:hypothetical protein
MKITLRKSMFLPCPILLFALLLGLTSFQVEAEEITTASIHQRESVESVVAVVNQTVITKTQLLDKIHRELYSAGIIPSDPFLRLGRRFLEDLIDEELLYEQAEKEKFTAPPEILDESTDLFLKKVENLFPDEESFLRHIHAMGLGYSDFKKKIQKWEEREYCIDSLVSKNISILEKDVQEYIDQLKREGKPAARYRLSHLFLKFPEDAEDKEKEAIEKRALDLLAQIQGGADFTRLVRKYSEDEVTRKRGGDLGTVEEGGFDKAIDQAVKNLKEGDISMPIRTDGGVHLVRLESLVDGRRLLFQERYKKERARILEELRAAAIIRILGENLD